MYNAQHPGPSASTQLMTPSQVARAFNVSVTTITRWADSGKIAFIRTPSGQRRYEESIVAEMLEPTEESDVPS